MKKILYFVLLSSFISAHALCPLEIDGESVCSITNYKDSSIPIFQNKNAENNLQSQSQKLQPFNMTNPIGQSREAESIRQKNSIGCQFGICVQNQNSDLNSKQ